MIKIDYKGKEFNTQKEMLDYYKINRATFVNRIKAGWSLKDALTISIRQNDIADKLRDKNTGLFFDHKGNSYESIIDMCDAYDVTQNAFYHRMKSGKNLQYALTYEIQEKKHDFTDIYKDSKTGVYFDHLGNEYEALDDMLETYGISLSTFRSRLHQGKDLENALTAPVLKKGVKDHLGNYYKNRVEMCEKYGITLAQYKYYQKRNYPLKEILTHNAGVKVYDHLGTPFDSVKEMCDYYSIDLTTYGSRRDCKWPLEKILTTPKTDYITKDHLGNEFKTKNKMCEYYNISINTFRKRIKAGMSVGEALETPVELNVVSYGEKTITAELNKRNITFFHNMELRTIFKKIGMSEQFEDFVDFFYNELLSEGVLFGKASIRKMRPDFAIIKNKEIHSFIEFDGAQHFMFIRKFFKCLEEFLRRSNSDFVKNNFSEQSGIPLLRIRYDQINLAGDMIDDLMANPSKYLIQHNTYLSEEEYWLPLKKTKKKIENKLCLA